MAYPPEEFWEIENITIPATAGNATYTAAVPTGYRYIVESVFVTLVADGNAANRLVALSVDDGTNQFIGATRNNTAITAGQTRSVTWMRRFGYHIGGQVLSPDIMSMRWSAILKEGDRLVLEVSAGLVGDSFSGIIRVLKIRT